MGYDEAAARHRRKLFSLLDEAERAYLAGNALLYTDRLRALATALMAGGDSLRAHFHARVGRLRSMSTAPGSGAKSIRTPATWRHGPAIEDFGRRNSDCSKVSREIGAPIWSSRNPVKYPEFGGTQHYWWSCPRPASGHADWQQTLWQYERGRTCPRCWAQFMGHASWRPKEVRWGGLVKFGDAQVLESDALAQRTPSAQSDKAQLQPLGRAAPPRLTRAEGISRLIDIYRAITGVESTPKLEKNLDAALDLSRLMNTDDDTLETAGRWLGGGGGKGFPVSSWAWAVKHVSTTRPGSTSAELESRVLTSHLGERVLLAHIGQYVDESMSRLEQHYTGQVLQEARRRIIDRAATAEYAAGAYARRLPKWGHVGSRPVRSVPVIDGDDCELAVVHLLALTWPDAQFSYTPAHSGLVFAGWKGGWHRHDEERVYISGLSDVLDTATSIVQEHRDYRGGRIFINGRSVVCAECQEVVAWVGHAGDDRKKAPSHGD